MIGPWGAAINLALLRTELQRPARVALALVVTFAAVLLWSWLVVEMP